MPIGQIAWNKGLTKADPRVAKNAEGVSRALKGRKRNPHSLETCKKISIKLKGNKNPLGHKWSNEAKSKFSLLIKGILKPYLRGIKNGMWQGGKSFESYTIDWTNTLRRSIRERDYYTCQMCKEPQGDVALDVHHINYDKKNCNPNNLITLCRGCHIK